MPKQGITMANDARTRSIVALAKQLRALNVCSERVPCHVVVLPGYIPCCVVFPIVFFFRRTSPPSISSATNPLSLFFFRGCV